MQKTRTSVPRRVVLSLLVLTGLVWAFLGSRVASTDNLGKVDFIGYWSATYLFGHGQNPYDLQSMETLQHAQMKTGLDVTIMAWNPPSLFVLLLPFSWLPFDVARLAFLIINFVILSAAGWMLSLLYLQPSNGRLAPASLIVALSFPPVLSGIYMGQVTFLVLLGLVGCMALIKRGEWFWAGAILILVTIKPHLVLLPVIYLLVYMARHRQYRGWLGLAFAAVFCALVLFVLRPPWINDLIGVSSIAPVHWATPTIGGLLSYLGVTEAARSIIILFLPLPFILSRYEDKIGMETAVAILTLITVPTTFFGWSYDQTILLIPIMQVIGWAYHLNHKTTSTWLIFAIGAAWTLSYAQKALNMEEVFYGWLPLFWWVVFGLVWYRVRNTHRAEVPTPGLL